MGAYKILLIAVLISVFFILGNFSFAKYSGGSGTSEDPYKIADANDLLALAADANDYTKCFILTADVNLQGQVFTTAIIAANTVEGYDFEGMPFRGTFDGNHHKVTQFAINGGSNMWFLGLFGLINGGMVRNLGLESFTVSGSSNCYYIGGLSGENWGNISNCYLTGAVSGYQSVGGLAGENAGSISNCYSTGAVTGVTDYCAGLVGENDGSISNCYTTGAVSGYDGIGGLAGWNGGSSSISNCYSTGIVSGSADVGGLVGVSYGSVVNSFWDTQTSGLETSAGGTGETTAQMKTLSTFTSAGWDFTSVWGLPLGQYPMLFLRQAGDLNLDGRVDMFDFAIFAQHWLEGVEP